MLVIDEVPHRPYMAYQVLSADHYVSGDVGATLRAIIARLRGLDHGIDAGRARRAPDLGCRRSLAITGL